MILAGAVVVGLTVLACPFVWRLGGVLRRRRLKQVVVTLDTGESFRGVLREHDSEAWVLVNAEVLKPNEAPVAVDGELIVLTANIAYAQKP